MEKNLLYAGIAKRKQVTEKVTGFDKKETEKWAVNKKAFAIHEGVTMRKLYSL